MMCSGVGEGRYLPMMRSRDEGGGGGRKQGRTVGGGGVVPVEGVRGGAKNETGQGRKEGAEAGEKKMKKRLLSGE